LFTGRRVDILDSGSLKIQYNRNRYYDYYTGRWLTHDPLGIQPNPHQPNVFYVIGQYSDSINMYEYVVSNPVANADEYGFGVCCKISWDTTYSEDYFYGPEVAVTNCTQDDIPAYDCPPEQACCAHYKDRPEIRVDGAYESEHGCCWCKVYKAVATAFPHHTFMHVKCEQGRGDWYAHVDPPGSGTLEECVLGVTVEVDVIEASPYLPTGELQGSTSCDAADRWRANWEGASFTWNIGHNCWWFARLHINHLTMSCPL
jgi:RHS repeat-associated protein